ncbi:MAG: DNA primase [Proteobacteria bacterium]|nr:DNA primase [Pseudomonadota bacterium]
MSRIAEDVVAQIRERTDIVEVIGRHVQLKRAGASFKGLCPFHEEKTPSFNVNPLRGFFHCFGCHTSGDVIAFLMQVEGRAFGEVIEDLGRRAGVEVLREGGSSPDAQQARERAEQRSERERARELNARVAVLYARCLQAPIGEPARAYLAERGIDGATAELFQIGYAPPAGTLLAQKLPEAGVALELAERLGLVVRRRHGDGFRDRFWNRIIFPVVGPGDEVLGFGGRLIAPSGASSERRADAGPKYLNTPETVLYRKGEVLYGMAQAATGIRQGGQSLLVEGNFDVIQLFQHGFRSAVAPMGTALTVAQVRLLGRFAPAVVAIFDGDDAGRAAALKSVRALLEGRLEAKIGVVPAGEDPDSLLRKGGRAALQRVLDDAVPAVDYLIDELRKTLDDSIPGRARLLEQVAPIIGLLPSRVAQDLYVDRLSFAARLERGVVLRAVREAAGGANASGPRGAASSRTAVAAATLGARSEVGRAGPQGGAGAAVPADPAADAPESSELELLKLLLGHPLLLPRARQAGLAILLTNEQLRATYAAAEAAPRDGSGRIDVVELLRTVPVTMRDAVAVAASAKDYLADGDWTKAFDDCVASMAARRADRILGAVKGRIARAEQQRMGSGEAAAQDKRRLIRLTGAQSRIRRAREQHQAETVWALIHELVEVEQEIHETQ